MNICVKYVTLHYCHQEVKQLQMPTKAATHRTNEPGDKFLQAIHEKPEFVCTCCHGWLFCHSVMVYDEKKYNMNNSIVRKNIRFEILTSYASSSY